MHAVKERFLWLDALRGFAALVVVFTHSAGFGLYANEPYWSISQLPPLRLLFTGHQAVILFFVLSGFALYTLLDRIPLPAPRFIWSRFLRIYPPYLVAVLLAVASLWIPRWIGTPWPPKNIGIPTGLFGVSDIISHVLLIGSFQPKLINPPIWSLVYEMRLSILFPLIYFVVSRCPFKISIALPILAAIMAALWFFAKPNVVDILRTFHYATMFFIGAYVAKNRHVLIDRVRALRATHKWFILAAATMLYLYSFGFTWPMWPRYIGEIGTAIAAAVFIALTLPLSIQPPQWALWLGRISFSLYLTHHIVIHIVAIYGYGRLPLALIWPLTIGGAVLFAAAFYRLVEKPSHTASKAALYPERLRSATVES